VPIPSPNLDDRTFQQLLDEATLIVKKKSPDWTDRTPSDPGMVLLEAFAYLTESMIYRLNLLPDKAFREFLRLIGVRMWSPSAASVELTFARSQPGNAQIDVPRGTQVTLARPGGGPPPVFVTLAPAAIAADQQQVTGVVALHCEVVEGELAGLGTGLGGLSVTARRAPIVAPTPDGLELLVGVEPEDGEHVPGIRFGHRTYRVWREVDGFSETGPDDFVYVADRLGGVITFAPSAALAGSQAPRLLGAAPGAGREIRLWYRRGGGPEGNVGPGTLTVVRTPPAGVTVTNPAAATGGAAAETLENALVRGPRELMTLNRAVTAGDFEFFAEQSAAVARARALTRTSLWTFATPGSVEVVLVPQLTEAERAGGVTAAVLEQHQTADARAQVQTVLDQRRPLGTRCLVDWARYKTVGVSVRLGVRREEDPDAVSQRVLDRLHQTINPLRTALNPEGRPFGQSLRVSEVYYLAQLEPGVRWVDSPRFTVDPMPVKDVRAVIADPHQPTTWYVASGDTLYRSLNGGDGWEPARRLQNEEADLVACHPDVAGLLAFAGASADHGSTIRFSTDCAETWDATEHPLGFRVNDMAWTTRDGAPLLLLATDRGLYELGTAAGASPVQVLVDPATQALGFYAVVTVREVRGESTVAVAAQNLRGVFLSNQAGRTNTFRSIGQQGEDVRVLAVQVDGPTSVLWSGVAVEGVDDPGKGCRSWELRGADNPPGGWQNHAAAWRAGSCRGIAFLPGRVLAATHHAGVLALDLPDQASGPGWTSPPLSSGLPLRDRDRDRFLFDPVDGVATGRDGHTAMAVGARGVFRTDAAAVSYVESSASVATSQVTLPPTWLFVSGEHRITTVWADEIG
jgi:hypothetical protein